MVAMDEHANPWFRPPCTVASRESTGRLGHQHLLAACRGRLLRGELLLPLLALPRLVRSQHVAVSLQRLLKAQNEKKNTHKKQYSKLGSDSTGSVPRHSY